MLKTFLLTTILTVIALGTFPVSAEEVSALQYTEESSEILIAGNRVNNG